MKSKSVVMLSHLLLCIVRAYSNIVSFAYKITSFILRILQWCHQNCVDFIQWIIINTSSDDTRDRSVSIRILSLNARQVSRMFSWEHFSLSHLKITLIESSPWISSGSAEKKNCKLSSFCLNIEMLAVWIVIFTLSLVKSLQ